MKFMELAELMEHDAILALKQRTEGSSLVPEEHQLSVSNQKRQGNVHK